ncbi:PBSX family phage terminase large subunit [Arthrobacter cavernae]|uniref:Terminase large subunit n=1 Tax=Arthrobacter cavernae TaxID=2817681 RepID=A0A939HC48_9MICC|nr:terminase large subunit [Arthrobacter cavernae]MBO1267081.1 terminase large subunit [Arthrobacter cavernae]
MKLRKRIKLIPGGTSGGKTISILQILIDRSQSDTKPKLTSVVSESFPHLRKGAMRDFLNIMHEHNYFDPSRWSKTDFTYTFETGSQIEFFSADQPSKVRGPRRDRLYVNEANNVPQEAWEQLLFRTREDAWADWNPVTDFYMYEDYGINDEAVPASAHDDRVDVVILTYKDNEGLEPAIIEDIERKAKLNKQWGRVYAEGKRGELEGKIFTGWQIIDEIPHEARLERRGLDFGYSNDPTAIVDLYSYNGGIILDEQLYQKGMSNKQIADLIINLPSPKTLVVADSSEPKSIDELSSYGINVIPANKGQGSVLQGIQKLQDQRVSITQRSTNGIKEYRNYMWITDKDGKILNVPMDMWNHFMDATRYANETYRPSTGPPRVSKPAWVKQSKRIRR